MRVWSDTGVLLNKGNGPRWRRAELHRTRSLRFILSVWCSSITVLLIIRSALLGRFDDHMGAAIVTGSVVIAFWLVIWWAGRRVRRLIVEVAIDRMLS